MERSQGKLIPFLDRGLNENLYPDLYYEDNNCEIINLYLPRYNKSKPQAVARQECLLKDWHRENGRGHKYESYPIAKAAFQACLKKSIYLIELPKIDKNLRFRKATSEEVEEKKRLFKEKERGRSINPPSFVDLLNDTFHGAFDENDPAAFADDVSLYTTSSPPSVESSGSSGYQSRSGDDLDDLEDIIEKEKEELRKSENRNELLLNSFDPVDFFCKDILNEPISEKSGILKNMELDLPVDLLKSQVTSQQYNITQAVEEISATRVDVSEFVRTKTYWLCNKKINVDSTLLLICEKQALEIGSQIAEGTVVIPNGVLNQGVVYYLKKFVEFDEKKFLFFSPHSV